MKYKKTILTISTFVILFAVMFFYNSTSPVKQIHGTVSNKAPSAIVSHHTSKETKHRQRADQLTKALNNFSALQVDNKNSELSFAELIKKTSPHYFKLASTVLENMLQEQESDNMWSLEIEEAAAKALKYEESEGTELLDIDCRQTLCKTKFTHLSLDKYKSFMDGRMDLGPWLTGAGNAHGSYKIKENESIESFIYHTHNDDHHTFIEMRKKMSKIIDSNQE